MDRPIIAILKPEMSADFGWTDADFGELAAITQFAAALAFLFTGWMVDWLGVRRSMIVGVTTWSLAAIAHGWAFLGWQVIAARVGLGATEAVQTPLAIKTVATLFPKAERSFAFGIMAAIGSLGTICLPFLIPPMAAIIGWRGSLVIGGIAGFVTLGFWLWFARHVRFNDRAEDESRDYADDLEPYGPILRERRTWAIVIAKLLSDATWWLMNFWLPDFYRREYGLSTTELAVPVAIAFLGSAVGGLAAGWISTKLLNKGWSVNRVRKTVMLVCSLLVLPLPIVLSLESFWLVAIMMGVVMAGHQGFSMSLFSTITDVVPREKVGRVTSFGAFMGNMGGVAISLVTGQLLANNVGYGPLFMFAGVSYLIALAWLHWLLPTIGGSRR
jgi:ACS family hexuronate transporter-like MFS transporter